MDKTKQFLTEYCSLFVQSLFVIFQEDMLIVFSLILAKSPLTTDTKSTNQQKLH